ncbi:MAG: single-stranded-DNA-specific exonuclease RecJ [Holosporales bacterium]|jgi:single-stranded-DNA-specific exonuclease|nr:single-stranded-DNA-specific exonuclease RecJ [Holosporales bacterium]
MKRKSGVSDLVARILVNRGISDKSEVEAILNPKLRYTIPDPSRILDMDHGVSRMIEAIVNKQRVVILGDYDADGITSTCLIVQYLRLVGLVPQHYIPNRFNDGYGVSQRSIQNAINDEVDLIITVDTGTNSVAEIDAANEAGIDLIIIDHHAQLVDTLPSAVAVINPNRRDQEEIVESNIKHLCAAGVSFLFLIALQRKLKSIGFFEIEPNLLEFIDVVALGTLCDVTELKGLNRAILKYTLTRGRYSPGIVALTKAFKLNGISSADDLAFFIGPAINAAGRLGDPHLALNLLLEQNPAKLQRIAEQLVFLNDKRKCIEKQIFAEALLFIGKKGLSNNRCICVFSDTWHEGVIGIIAGRIKDRFMKPAFVVSFAKDEEVGKGSARSIPGIHLGQFLDIAKSKSIIESGGGHELAGGFTVLREKMPEFLEFIEANTPVIRSNCLDIDLSIFPSSNLRQIFSELQILAPFGKGLPKPTICIKRARIRNVRGSQVGGHLFISITGEMGSGGFRAVLFNATSKPELVKCTEASVGNLVDIAGYIDSNDQYPASIIIEDIRLSQV